MLSVLALALVSGSVTFTWAPSSDPAVEASAGGDRVSLPGSPVFGHPGSPLLPLVPLTVALPPGAVADSVVFRPTDVRIVPGRVRPSPAQRGVPVSRPGDFVFTPENPEAYSVDWEMCARLQGQGTLMGYNVADLVLRPVAWNHETSLLTAAYSIDITVCYHLGNTPGGPAARGLLGSALAADIVAGQVVNPEDVTPLPVTEDLPWGEYLIVAPDNLAAAFQPLAQWKTLKGVPASIVTMGYINDSYSGVDPAQRLRFFLADIYQNAPPTFVLLAGDTPGIPHRNCYATAEGYVDYPSADLYYQDMNDTAPGVDAWDLNGNGVWGELYGADNMDYHPDYVLGRASVEDHFQAQIFIEKVLAYENAPDTPAWYNSMGFTTSVLWSNPYCPGCAGKEKVDTLYTPEGWTITKLYEDWGTQSYAATMAMLNQGMHLVNHAGHGSEGYVSIGSGGLSTSDFMGLTNISQNGRPSIWNTIACLSGSFDTGTCLAEAWIRSPGGGGFCIMNTRYGWGEPSDPGNQWSELVDQEFFACFFTDDAFHLGDAYMCAKDNFVPLIPSDTHYDWIAKSNTLFGDPELPMWLYIPQEMEISPVQLNQGQTTLQVAVASGGVPLENARVCLLQGGWDQPVTYSVALTDPSGQAVLSFPGLPAEPQTAQITVWARDHVTSTQTVSIGSMGVEQGFREALSLVLLSPNPVAGTIRVGWSSPVPCRLDLFDLAGRVAWSSGARAAGSGTATLNSGEIPPGVYFIRLEAPGSAGLGRRLVVVR